MTLFWRVKRDSKGLWVKMYSSGPYPYYAASRLITNRREAKAAFAEFVAGVKAHR